MKSRFLRCSIVAASAVVFSAWAMPDRPETPNQEPIDLGARVSTISIGGHNRAPVETFVITGLLTSWVAIAAIRSPSLRR